MGLDTEELAEARALQRAEAKARGKGPDPVVGELIVRRRARDVAPFLILLVLAPMISGLGQPIPAAALATVTVVAFFVHRRRRVARLAVGPDGSLALPGHAEIDWASLRSLQLEYRYPWMAAEHKKAHDETLHLVFERADGSTITLSRGALWRIRPTRAPVGYYALDRWLKARAREAGMTIGRPAEGRKGWTARRGSPPERGV